MSTVASVFFRDDKMITNWNGQNQFVFMFLLTHKMCLGLQIKQLKAVVRFKWCPVFYFPVPTGPIKIKPVQPIRAMRQSPTVIR